MTSKNLLKIQIAFDSIEWYPDLNVLLSEYFYSLNKNR